MNKPAAANPRKAMTKSRLSAAERRSKFLEAAAAIVVEQGLPAVTMEEVAARTGVNKRLGYRYFTNREELLRALLNQEMREAGSRARAILPAKPDLRQLVSANIQVWLELARERGPLLSKMFSDDAVFPDIAKEVHDLAVKDWAAVLRNSHAIPKARADVVARMYLAALRGAVDALGLKVATLDEIVSIYTTVAVAGADAVAKLKRAR
ncbi:AcrR family transcriptional regulator [Rhodanobacter sp. ANJX3]|jgi:AcrR family transcriptional regulator|uniref:TetR/AcrR family transcriptional regulator n=1 Tax=unclassified Rhodanobacter TaxID=2621553 RepID=UPI0015CE56C8|nr:MULTISPECIES: TetR/AcrR family transcriptional regulator [unclassified Rhodanobacter]MBB5357472.1 AcrR family transcriptional regulator [Rhodanobacter sp. ANJX3]NYE27521.1 AcrR family transcriptional regulator [Rhodanobacter sp. K2T2]